MPSIRSFAAAAALLTLPLGACAPVQPVVYAAPAPEFTAEGTASYLAAAPGASPVRYDRHVIVVSIDGLRPDAIERFGAKNLQRLIDEGRYSLSARTILPSLTLPSHTSMLTGVEPSVHGITWNDNQVSEKGTVQVPTMFRVARDHGLTTAAVASKGKFNHLLSSGDLDYFVLPEGNGSWSSGRTAEIASRYLAVHKPNLLFVHLREPDHYGHMFGWMGMIYGWAVGKADDALGQVIESADAAYGEDGYTLIVTADHGGHGRHHGSEEESDVTIPWIVWGAGVEGDGEIAAPIRTMDTAATALWRLGVTMPGVVGTPVAGAFEESGRRLAADHEAAPGEATLPSGAF